MKVEVNIETSWAHGGHTFTVDILDDDVEGYSEEMRDGIIEDIVNDEVANYVSWGWHIVS